MHELDPVVAEVLDRLYGAAVEPTGWPDFLERLGALFAAPTATLRVADLHRPLLHASFTVGFVEETDREYRHNGVATDPFREAMAATPIGYIHGSDDIISDTAFSRSTHYERVFRPNGNFYAMGGHFERDGESAMYVGVHRPESDGRFREQERRGLGVFVPHLRRAARVSRRLGEVETTLRHAHAVLDELAFGVWVLDRQRRVRWANRTAEEALRTGTFGLRREADRLVLADAGDESRLRAAVTAVGGGGERVCTVPLGGLGAALVLVDPPSEYRVQTLARDRGEATLAFLFDPARPSPLDDDRLVALYALTPAELRLLDAFMRGLDLHETAAALGVSIHTARAQMKSCLQKVGVHRQPELMRKILLGATQLRRDPS